MGSLLRCSERRVPVVTFLRLGAGAEPMGEWELGRVWVAATGRDTQPRAHEAGRGRAALDIKVHDRVRVVLTDIIGEVE